MFTSLDLPKQLIPEKERSIKSGQRNQTDIQWPISGTLCLICVNKTCQK